jgi:hypothetical protein
MRGPLFLCVSCLVLAAGCTTAPVTSTSGRSIHTSAEARITGPFVAAGTQFTARLDRPLDTMATTRGETFTAVLDQPLVDQNGRAIVPAGARLTGRVDSVMGVNGPRLRLDFQGVQTTAGFAPIEARVDASTAQTYLGPPRYVAQPYGYDSWYGPYYGGYPYPYGGGPSGYVYDEYRPREVHLPAGAVLRLTLTHPLIAPSANVQ